MFSWCPAFLLVLILLFRDKNSVIIQLKNQHTPLFLVGWYTSITFVLSDSLLLLQVIHLNKCASREMLMLLCTLVLLVSLTSDVIHCISCISSLPETQPPACLFLITTAYAARCAFVAHFILWALHAFLPKISVLATFILNYIHMSDIGSWKNTVATIGWPRKKKIQQGN